MGKGNSCLLGRRRSAVELRGRDVGLVIGDNRDPRKRRELLTRGSDVGVGRNSDADCRGLVVDSERGPAPGFFDGGLTASADSSSSAREMSRLTTAAGATVDSCSSMAADSASSRLSTPTTKWSWLSVSQYSTNRSPRISRALARKSPADSMIEMTGLTGQSVPSSVSPGWPWANRADSKEAG